MPQIDFTPLGLAAQWPSSAWLDFLDGPSEGPVVGVQLAHSSSSAALYVCTYLRSRFDATMARADEDPVQELAAIVAQQTISRVLSQVDAEDDLRSTLTKLLMRYSIQHASDYGNWATSEWRMTSAGPGITEITARFMTLAGWQSGFSVAGESYIAAYAYGAELEHIVLRPVLDTSIYDFTLNDAILPANIPPGVPGNTKSQALHSDLARMLASENGS